MKNLNLRKRKWGWSESEKREIREIQERLSEWGWKGDITDSIIDISDLDYDELCKKGKASDYPFPDWRIEDWFYYSDEPDKVLVNPDWYDEYEMNDLNPPDWVEISPKFIEGRYDISYIAMNEDWNSEWKSKELDKIESDLGISFDSFMPMGKSIGERGKDEFRYSVVGIGERREDTYHYLPDVEKYLAVLIIPYDDDTGVCIIRNDVVDQNNLVKDVSDFRQQHFPEYDFLDKWVQNHEQAKPDLKAMQEKLDSLAEDKGLATGDSVENENVYE